jgi:hypothetical protein
MIIFGIGSHAGVLSDLLGCFGVSVFGFIQSPPPVALWTLSVLDARHPVWLRNKSYYDATIS